MQEEASCNFQLLLGWFPTVQEVAVGAATGGDLLLLVMSHVEEVLLLGGLWVCQLELWLARRSWRVSVDDVLVQIASAAAESTG